VSRAGLICVAAVLVLGLLPAPADAVAPSFRSCGAIESGLGGLRIFGSPEAFAEEVAHPHDTVAYSTGVSGAGAGCSFVWELLRQVLPRHGADEANALVAAGFTPVHVQQLGSERAGFTHYGVVAVGFGVTVRYQRTGGAPDDVYAVNAGERLYFSKAFGGSLIDTNKCTAAFTVRFADGRLGQLSAGHCGWEQRRFRHDKTFPFVSRDHGGLPFRYLSQVQRNLDMKGRLDALEYDVAPAPGFRITRLVARGLAPPVMLTGVAKLGRLDPGDTVCFSGITSGEHCGGVRRGTGGKALNGLGRVFEGNRVVCTKAKARHGDSGSPVYTRPSGAGTARAVGIVSLAAAGSMCFTPLQPVLDALGAQLAPGVAGGPIVA
jgi:hypothetical protein